MALLAELLTSSKQTTVIASSEIASEEKTVEIEVIAVRADHMSMIMHAAAPHAMTVLATQTCMLKIAI